MLYREPKLLKANDFPSPNSITGIVSVLYREPKLLKVDLDGAVTACVGKVSVLYREPKLLKGAAQPRSRYRCAGRFSALP